MSKKKPAYVDGKFVGDTLSISVKPHYQKEYEFLKAHHNRSGLICELVRQYIEGGGVSIGYQQYQQPIENQQPTPQIAHQENVSEQKEEVKEIKNTEDKKEIVDDRKKIPVMSMPSFLNG